MITLLRAEADRLQNLSADTVWYLFGSTTGDAARPSDIDLLIVHNPELADEAADLLEALDRLTSMPLPLHAQAMSSLEVAGIGLPDKALRVWPVT